METTKAFRNLPSRVAVLDADGNPRRFVSRPVAERLLDRGYFPCHGEPERNLVFSIRPREMAR